MEKPNWMQFRNFIVAIPLCEDCLEHRAYCPCSNKRHWHLRPQPACASCGDWHLDLRRRGRARVKRAYPNNITGDIILEGHYSRPAVHWR